jgi:hypothetical protein
MFMRRIPAIFLLVLLCFGFALPFLQAQPGTPVCCRRDGKHHCGSSPEGDGFHTSAPNCPYRNMGMLTSPSAALNVRPLVLTIGLYGQPRVGTVPAQIALQASDHTQKRGPPVS